MKIHELIRRHKELGLTDDPKFDKACKWDWRNYVPDEIKTVWKDMTVESRIMVYLTAETQCQHEMCRWADS